MKPTNKSVCRNCANEDKCRDRKYYDKRGETCLYCGRQEEVRKPRKRQR